MAASKVSSPALFRGRRTKKPKHVRVIKALTDNRWTADVERTSEYSHGLPTDVLAKKAGMRPVDLRVVMRDIARAAKEVGLRLDQIIQRTPANMSGGHRRASVYDVPGKLVSKLP